MSSVQQNLSFFHVCYQKQFKKILIFDTQTTIFLLENAIIQKFITKQSGSKFMKTDRQNESISRCFKIIQW